MPPDFAKLADQVDSLFSARKFDEICVLLKQYDALPSELLLRKSAAIQLADDAAGYELEDAKSALVAATKIGLKSPLPWIELGHFMFAVEDNAAEALKCFERAEAMSIKMLGNLVIGHASALKELGRFDEALSMLDRFGQLIRSAAIDDLRFELLQSK